MCHLIARVTNQQIVLRNPRYRYIHAVRCYTVEAVFVANSGPCEKRTVKSTPGVAMRYRILLEQGR